MTEVCQQTQYVPTFFCMVYGYLYTKYEKMAPEKLFPQYADGHKPCHCAIRVLDTETGVWVWGHK